MSAAISFEQVGKRYGETTVIPDFSLRIAAGESLVLLGPSGCGKSTLLRMLAGLEATSAGRILIGDKEVTHLAPGQRGVAMVFQQYALYPHMSVADNMAFGLRNVKVPEAEIQRRIQEAARVLELQPLLERRPGQLSGGQRQRVAIGRALVKEPKAFLFDEPLSNLDAKLRARTRVELARLHQRLRATMIFVTHDQVEAMTLADRIAVMNAGRIEQVAEPLTLYHRPATRFVAGFVGSPGMNFLPLDGLQVGADGHALGQHRGGAVWGTQIAASELPSGDKLELGVRPEALRLLPSGSPGSLNAKIEVVEHLGERSLAHLSLEDGSLLVAELKDPGQSAVGDVVGLGADPAHLHLFDAKGRAYSPLRA